MTAPTGVRVTKQALAAARAAAVATAHELPTHPDPWPHAIQHTLRALIHRLADARALPEPQLPYRAAALAEQALNKIGELTDWTIHDLGEINQQLLCLRLVTHGRTLVAEAPKGTTRRDEQGSWYTPQPVAREMTRLSLNLAIERLLEADDPDQILRLNAVDPACGAGVFLVEAARTIAEAYARRLTEGEPPPGLVALVLPMVTYECVYGMDIDPVAIDLAKAALWFEVGARVPFGWLDGNVACVDPLGGPNSLPGRLLGVMSGC